MILRLIDKIVSLPAEYISNAMNIPLSSALLEQATLERGEQGYTDTVIHAVSEAAGGEITAQTLQQLSTSQLTLLAFDVLKREVDEGGFIQLIHNGWGPFFFHNPFAKVMKMWGLRELAQLVYDASRLYARYADELTAEMDDDTFMALYETHPAFDELDDTFIDQGDTYVHQLATYIKDHLSDFVTLE